MLLFSCLGAVDSGKGEGRGRGFGAVVFARGWDSIALKGRISELEELALIAET